LKIVLAFLTLVFIFSGCGSQKRVVVAEPKEYPLWYLKPPRTDSATLYGVGDGQNKEDAIANALTMMISTLSVSISSKFDSKSVIKEGVSSSNQATYTNEVQSEVQKIHISNYDVLNSQSMGYKQHIVLVKSDKKKLFDGLKKEIDQKFYMIKEKENSLSRSNTIEKLSVYKSFQNSLQGTQNSLMVMSVLDPSFNDIPYLRKIQELDDKYQKTLSNITFSIESNKPAHNLKSVIAKAISEKHYKIKKASGKNHFKIYIKSNIQKAKSYGFTLARSAIDITIKDSKGAIIGSNKLDIVGQSTAGYDVAIQNVAFKLNAIIEKDGIEKVIGLKI